LFAFLDQIHLVSIALDGSGTNGQDFGRDVDAAIEWASSENARGRGIYWTVNRVQPGCNRKPAKFEIESARFAHVDIDPPKDGKSWEKKRALADLQALPCPPTFTIDSGNGLQAFWRFSDPTDNQEAIENLNADIARHVGGDACHNIDRLVRVPGFINFPNKSKRAAGRRESLAGWAQADNGATYSPADLAAAFGHRSDAEAIAEWRQQHERASDAVLIARCQSGDYWHNSMTALAARMVAQGRSDDEILGSLAAPITIDGYSIDQTCREVRTAITSARKKWDRPAPETPSIDQPRISATPFSAPETFDVAPRIWVFGHWLLRGTVTAVIAPGGAGKSALMVAVALSLASGQPILVKTVFGGAKRVWLWNLEDDRDELTRQLVACSLHHGISERDYDGRLFVNDARSPISLAIKDRNGLTIHNDSKRAFRSTLLPEAVRPS
jgi:hypothetical protein